MAKSGKNQLPSNQLGQIRPRRHELANECASEAAGELSRDESVAMLSYMLDHNCAHADELARMSIGLDDAAESVLASSVAAYKAANDLLAIYIRLAKQGG